MPISADTVCPHCNKAVFYRSRSGNRIKTRTNILVLHGNGSAEINCSNCGKGLTVGRLDNMRLEKAIAPRLVIKNKKT